MASVSSGYDSCVLCIYTHIKCLPGTHWPVCLGMWYFHVHLAWTSAYIITTSNWTLHIQIHYETQRFDKVSSGDSMVFLWFISATCCCITVALWSMFDCDVSYLNSHWKESLWQWAEISSLNLTCQVFEWVLLVLIYFHSLITCNIIINVGSYEWFLGIPYL